MNRMKKGLKARPHDIAEVMKMEPQMIEIHASSEDLNEKIDGQYNDVQVAIHLPEYDGTELMDLASLDEKKQFKSISFYDKAIEKSREWATHFRGTPKVILHPGGWSNEPIKSFEKPLLYDAFTKSWKELNKNGIDLLVENMPPQPWFYGGQWNCNIFLNPKECRDYCIGEGFGFCLDVCHAYLYCNWIGEMDIMRFMQIVKPIIAHIHISDGKGVDGEGLQIGEGEMPLKEIVKYISPIQVGVVPEIWQGHKDNYAGFKIAWERIKNINGANGNG